MKRIIFLNPFPADQISGGIKTSFVHADYLAKKGYQVFIHSPAGVPLWLEKGRFESLILPHDALAHFSVTEDDYLIFPESLMGWLADLLEKPLSCHKIIFCQNHYALYATGYSSERLKACGVERIITVGETARRGIYSILGDKIEIDIIPPFVNENIFIPPEKKELKILASGRKWLDEGYIGYIQRIFKQKYHFFPTIPWVELINMTEEQAAQEMKASAVCLFLGRMESCPLTPLEAMACGCGIVGFHGGGGLDYARAENGFWHSPEDILGVVDSLYYLLNGIWKEDRNIWQIIANGQKISQEFYSDNIKTILYETYANLLK